jgi:hypothetical protein
MSEQPTRFRPGPAGRRAETAADAKRTGRSLEHLHEDDPDLSADAEVQRFIDSGELDVESDAHAENPGADLVEAAVERAREQWQIELTERLAEAEACWTDKSEKRLAIARGTAQRAESALEDLRRELVRTQATLAAQEKELSETRSAHERERERWRQSPAAAQQAKAARDLQFQRRAKIALRLILDLALTVLVMALAMVTSERAAPIATDVWRHETGPNGDLRPLLQRAGIPVKDAGASPRTFVDAPVANLRAHPAKGAPIVGTLSRDVEVTPMRRHGRWVLVRIGSGADQWQGWVADASLKEIGPAPVSAAH